MRRANSDPKTKTVAIHFKSKPHVVKPEIVLNDYKIDVKASETRKVISARCKGMDRYEWNPALECGGKSLFIGLVFG